MKLLNLKLKISYIIIFSLVSAGNTIGQDISRQDTLKSIVKSGITKDVIHNDTLTREEISPLDISKNRGLYIVTNDQKMQLRILGSVRFSAFYDNIELSEKNTFNTFIIPTGNNNQIVPNYHNSLNQTRIGFEITRKNGDKTVFIRLETDFDGPNGQFRIRHAYGLVGGFIVGKTWSLFSNVSDLPITVDKNGPTGTIALLNSQISYGKNYNNWKWAVGLEYSEPDVNNYIVDTTLVSFSNVQMIPDITAHISSHGKLGRIQLSLLLNSISIKKNNNEINNSLGYGASISGKLNLTNKQRIYYQFSYGKSIAHYISTFDGKGQDAVYNPITNEFEYLLTSGNFISYGYIWTPKISTNLSVGGAYIKNKTFQLDDAYNKSVSVSVDAFWRVVTGARIGMSYTYGQRWNKGGETGGANRAWLLFYYDF